MFVVLGTERLGGLLHLQEQVFLLLRRQVPVAEVGLSTNIAGAGIGCESALQVPPANATDGNVVISPHASFRPTRHGPVAHVTHHPCLFLSRNQESATGRSW
jgi:hypothetical protein